MGYMHETLKHAEQGKRLGVRSGKGGLTGGASAASMIGLTPSSGDCRRPRSFRTTKADLERNGGNSLMMFVSTNPGSAGL